MHTLTVPERFVEIFRDIVQDAATRAQGAATTAYLADDRAHAVATDRICSGVAAQLLDVATGGDAHLSVSTQAAELLADELKECDHLLYGLLAGADDRRVEAFALIAGLLSVLRQLDAMTRAELAVAC
jgi:hypothetical protein